MPLVQIFAKPPVEGRVKTRLIPDLGAEGATAVYLYCLQFTLNLLRTSTFNYEIWLGEAGEHAIFEGEDYELQQGNDLGERMIHALKHGFANNPNESILLIGSDCLDLTEMHLQQAINSLSRNELVLLPSLDGGFAMIGCRHIDSTIFENVEWSSDKVLHETLNNASKLGYRVDLLESVRDIDTLSDLNHYPQLLAQITRS